MTHSSSTFKAAEIGRIFKEACTQFDQLLASTDAQELVQIRTRLRQELQSYKQQGALTVALIGQYSAGKSTIISALTGRRDIYIDADIATDKTSSYDWNDIKLIDTPGLFTDRPDHDEITYGAISKADLLVFCLTHTLFDPITVENFKKLAYEKGYRWKMMLVINKMSSEAAEDEQQKIASYRHSLAEALKPYRLDEFPICFIDAKDYCEGVDLDDSFYTEVSRFDTFILELNHFVERRAALTRFDTPVRIVLACLDDAQIGFTRNSGEDTAFLEVLNRLSRRVNKERGRLRTKVKGITLDMSAAVAGEGTRLASAVGDANFEELNKQSEINVRRHYEAAGEALEDVIAEALESIRREVESELQSDLTQSFVAQLNFNSTVSAKNARVKANTQDLKSQVDWLHKIGEQVGAKLTQSAIKDGANIGQGFLRAGNVAGSSLHQGVYAIGKFVGFKFKPWQAVGIAKNIGNVAMFLGPALAIFSIGMDIHSANQERAYEQKMANIRRDITSQFQSFSAELEQQIAQQLREAEAQIYGQIEQKIAEARQQLEADIVNSNLEVNQLAAIRRSLEGILLQVQGVATGAAV